MNSRDGRPSEILDVLRQSKIPIREVTGDNWCHQNNRLSSCDFFSEVDEILQRMSHDGSESFASFLRRCCPDAAADVKKHALSYVTGNNGTVHGAASARHAVAEITKTGRASAAD